MENHSLTRDQDRQVDSKANRSLLEASTQSYWEKFFGRYNSLRRAAAFSREAGEHAFRKLEGSSVSPISTFQRQGRSLAEATQAAQRNQLEANLQCLLKFMEGRAIFKELFAWFLEEALARTQSEYGFLAEVYWDEEGAPFIRTHAMTNIAWDAETRALFSETETLGMEFRNLDTLFGAVLTEQEVIISNDPYSDPRAGGLPEGHPPLNTFLGVPVFGDGHLLGVIGLANRPGGYDLDLVDHIGPVITTYASYLRGWQNERDRRAIEEELRHARLLIQTLVDNMSSAVYFEDPSRRIRYVNRHFLCAFGIRGSTNAFLGMDSGLLVEILRGAFGAPDEYIDRVEEIVQNGISVHKDVVYLRNGKIYERDFTIVKSETHVVGYLWKFREASA